MTYSTLIAFAAKIGLMIGAYKPIYEESINNCIINFYNTFKDTEYEAHCRILVNRLRSELKLKIKNWNDGKRDKHN